ncbi:SulP family inorganic anion transporter [Arthrobacter sp. CJ23]|uniref:SulP family inorganic anion transporter n=1 Tax=Arthrobacter sp. CJ23 TaxID=2972479 RepID=UPI00215D4BD4|nr:SulP family inorganic anion transporter [Arthrobacter sp. CJ23]UVJ39240.1 SulP family inorganic anion transporter [Arthrobacter sp. CJ23]
MSATSILRSAADRLSNVWALKGYKREWLRHDLVAGAALFALLVPAGMAYAQAAGLPPVTGLYATVIPLLVYAAVGPSRILVLGPDSALAPMIAAAIVPLAAGSSEKSVALAGLLAVLIGMIMLAGSALRLGTITGLLSKPIRLGYLNGIALLVALSQLPAFLGIEADGDIWQKLAKVTTGVLGGGVNLPALLLGAGSLALIWIPRLVKWKVPGVLFAVVGSCIATAVWGLNDHVKVAGVLPQGLPAPALGGIGWADALTLLPAAAGIALMAFADTGVLSQTLAAKEGKRVSGNREMAALGAASAATGLLGGFPVSGSTSRTPVAVDAGAKSQMTGVVGAALVLAFMLLAPGVTEYLPSATLAAVVIAAAIALADPSGVRRLLSLSRSESAVMLAAFLGVLTVGVLQGIVVAIALAVLDFVRRAWDPYRAELGSEEGLPGYHDLARHPEGKRIPGLLILRFDAPLFFGNGQVLAGFVREQLDEASGKAPDAITHVILAAEPITGIDTTALEDLVTLDEWLANKGVDLVFAELKGPVKDKLLHLGAAARFTPEHFFPTIGAAVRALRRE